MTTPFGTAARAALSAPRPRVSTEDLIAAITRHTHPTVTLVADLSRGLLRLSDHASTTTHPLGDLATQMTRARITTDGIDTALDAWVEHRPVTVTDAAENGHLVLDWVDPAQTALTWVVAVPRPGGHLARFHPPLLAASDLASIRHEATTRSRSLTVTTVTSGAITLLTTDPVTLSTATLVRGISTTPDALIVLTPGAPVAVGASDAVHRLAEETNQPHVIVRPTQLPRIPA